MAGYSTPPMGKCGLNCPMCPHVKTKQGNKHNAFNCNSDMTVYLINCNNCEENYVGYCTGRLVESFNYHLNEVNNKNSLFAQHFKRCGIINLRIQVIEQGYSRNDLIEKRNKWENYLNPTIGDLGICVGCGKKIKSEKDLNCYKGEIKCSKCMDDFIGGDSKLYLEETEDEKWERETREQRKEVQEFNERQRNWEQKMGKKR